MADWEIEAVHQLKGEIEVPGDKSISHRAVMLGSIAEGKTRVKKWLFAEDILNTIRAFQGLGVEIEVGEELIIKGRGKSGLRAPTKPIDFGNSGTGMRLLAGILSGQPFKSVLTGDETLNKRPMKRIMEPLRLMGAEIKAMPGDLAPITIQGGKLKGIEYKLPVASAQVKSSILLASIYAEGITRLTEPAPTRDHTERLLKHFGGQIEKQGLEIKMKCGQELKAEEIVVPGDISSASFFIVAGILVPGARLIIKNVELNPTRTGILDALKKMGAEIELLNARELCGEPVGDLLVMHRALKGAEIKGDLIPRMIDEIPILAVAGALAEGETVIRDAKELRVKESDRISSMVSELRKMGAKIEELEDGMIIQGVRELKAEVVDSHKDHRIAMSLAIAGLLAKGKTVIKSVEWVETSFPDFLKKLKHLVA